MAELNLHKIEKKILLSLVNQDTIDIETLASKTSLSMDNVRRGIEWLKFKGLVSVFINKDSIVQLVSEQSNDGSLKDKTDGSVRLTLPERRIVNSLKNNGQNAISIGDLAKISRLSNIEFSVGIQNALRNGWLTKDADTMNLTENTETRSHEEVLLEKI